MEETKIARIPVTWKMAGILEIPYRLPEELSELIKQISMPKGKIIDGSYKLDHEHIEDINNHKILDDIAKALEEI